MKNIIISTIYRPPHTNVESFLGEFDRLLHQINLENKDVYLMGDFNIDLLQQDSTFQNMLQSNSFNATIDKPTRLTNESSTLIDNIFTNVISDHKILLCALASCIAKYLTTYRFSLCAII